MTNTLGWKPIGSIRGIRYLTQEISNKKGIYFMEPKLPNDFGALGHMTLVNKGIFFGKHYLNSPHFYQYSFWEIP